MINWEAEKIKLKLEEEYKIQIKKLKINRNVSLFCTGLTGLITIQNLGFFINGIINSGDSSLPLTLLNGGLAIFYLNQTRINVKISKKLIE